MKDNFREYARKKALLEQMQAEVAAMESSENYTQAIDYSKELEALNKKYNVSVGEAIELLRAMVTPFDQQAAKSRSKNGAAKGMKYKPLPLRRWTNPHTGEIVEARRSQTNQHREWIAQYGKEEVDRWAVVIEEGESA